MPKGAGDESSLGYEILETRQLRRDLERLGPTAQKRIEAKLRQYVYPLRRENPRWGPNIRRLKNWEPPTWRFRVGEWRFFYELDDARRLVMMTTADHRKEAYR